MKLIKVNNALLTMKGNRGLCVCFTFILLFFCGHPSFSNQAKVDDLITKTSHSTTNRERLRFLNELTAELLNSDLVQALDYAQNSLESAKEIEDRPKEAIALYMIGLILYETEERPSSLEYFQKSERIAEELNLEEIQVHILMSIANYHRYAAYDSTKTVENYIKSAEISKRVGFHWGAGRSYAKLASFYTRYNKIDLCEKYLELSAENYNNNPNTEKTIAHYYTEVGDKIWHVNPKKAMDLYFKGKEYKLIPTAMVSLANAHRSIGENEVAISYLKEAIPYFQKTEKRRRMLGSALALLAEAYMQQGDYQAANKVCDEGIGLLVNIGRSDQKALPDFYRIKGLILEKQGKDVQALRYFTLSQDEATRIKHAYARINSTLTLGKFYTTRNPEKAESYCKKSLSAARTKKHTAFEMESCDCLYNIYKARGSFVKALNFHELKIVLSDSLNTRTVSHALDVNNMMAEKDKLIGEQAYQEKIREKELKNQKLFTASLSAIILIGLLLIGILINNQKRVSKINEEINEKKDALEKANLNLERSNEELERFAHIASHDLKTPVRSIVSFTSLLRRKLENEENPDVSDLLDYIENGGKRMNRLIADVLEYSSLAGEATVSKELIDLKKLTHEIAQLQTSTKAQHVAIEVSDLPTIKWFHSRIYLLLKNLIENGIKYNESDRPTIKVYYKNVSGVHSIFVEDNGIGINSEYFDNIFKMFNRLHHNSEYEGSGLGLASCKKIVEEFEGDISITSEVNRGSIFRIDLPDHLIHNPVHKTEHAFAEHVSSEVMA